MLIGLPGRVARVIGAALHESGFAVGGGQALRAHRIVDRISMDLDAYADSLDPDVHTRAETRVVDALRAAGYDAEVVQQDSWFRVIIATERPGGERVAVDLGYDHRRHPPVHVEGVGPVLSLEDVVVGKVRALVDRRAERDYVDIDAIISPGTEWTVEHLVAISREIRPEIDETRLREIIARADEGDPVEYAALGLQVGDMLAMFDRLRTAAHPPRAPKPTSDTQRPADLSPPTRQSAVAPDGQFRCAACGRPLNSPDSIRKGVGPSCAQKIG